MRKKPRVCAPKRIGSCGVLCLLAAVLLSACSLNLQAEADKEIIVSPDIWEYADQCFANKTAADGVEAPESDSVNLYFQRRHPERFACEYFYETEQNERKRYICVLETQGDAIVLLRESDDPQEDINALLNRE